MRKIFISIACALLMTGCATKQVERDVEVPDADEVVYVYEIHTTGGICDTVRSHRELHLNVGYGTSTVVINEGKFYRKYNFVDRFTLIETEYIDYD